MLLQTQGDPIIWLALAAAVLMALTLIACMVAVRRTLQLREAHKLLLQAARKIETLDRRKSSLFNALPVALIETDATGAVTFTNRAAQGLLGLNKDSLTGQSFAAPLWRFSDPEGQALAAEALPVARALHGETVKGFAHQILTPAGKSVRVCVNAVPITNAAGDVTGTTLSLSELPDRPAAPETLQTIEAPQESLRPPEGQRYTDGMEYLTLKTRLGALQHEIQTLTQTKTTLEARGARLDRALNELSRFETAGRLSDQMTHDFGEMLRVINAALEIIGNQSPEGDVKQLAAAALAAGRRGERLTHQMKTLNSSETRKNTRKT